jgi:uncharacterized protein
MSFIKFKLIIIGIALGILFYIFNKTSISPIHINTQKITPIPTQPIHPLNLNYMKTNSYPGSQIIVEQTLNPGINYRQYIASYISEKLKIYALLTIPDGQPPTGGWPVILFNHGYIPPKQYRTTERYVAYVDEFARNGYIIFKPDYRGNGLSDGTPTGAYYSPDYTIDDLNALSSIKKYPVANPNKIGIWGHSMGGNITLRDLVINQDIKAAVIWGGVVGSYDDLIYNWQNRVSYHPPADDLLLRNNGRTALIQKHGTPKSNPNFWNSIDPTANLSSIITPIQLNVGGNDAEVPIIFSEKLFKNLQLAGKNAEYIVYPGSDHNISQSFSIAMQNSLIFFNKYLK